MTKCTVYVIRLGDLPSWGASSLLYSSKRVQLHEGYLGDQR
jgi:hypothetical protein